ncbi:hypothetical protein AgCh_024342 [Apium graveolens]
MSQPITRVGLPLSVRKADSDFKTGLLGIEIAVQHFWTKLPMLANSTIVSASMLRLVDIVAAAKRALREILISVEDAMIKKKIFAIRPVPILRGVIIALVDMGTT